MSGMSLYYTSRAIITLAFTFLLVFSGMEWWLAALMGFGVFGLFLWAPHSGRYAVHPELGITALRRDERTQIINDKATRNAFIVTIFAIAGITIYFWSNALVAVPIAILEYVLILGALTYFVSDLFLRRS